jgi:hypothetical protein
VLSEQRKSTRDKAATRVTAPGSSRRAAPGHAPAYDSLIWPFQVDLFCRDEIVIVITAPATPIEESSPSSTTGAPNNRPRTDHNRQHRSRPYRARSGLPSDPARWILPRAASRLRNAATVVRLAQVAEQ